MHYVSESIDLRARRVVALIGHCAELSSMQALHTISLVAGSTVSKTICQPWWPALAGRTAGEHGSSWLLSRAWWCTYEPRVHTTKFCCLNICRGCSRKPMLAIIMSLFLALLLHSTLSEHSTISHKPCSSLPAIANTSSSWRWGWPNLLTKSGVAHGIIHACWRERASFSLSSATSAPRCRA